MIYLLPSGIAPLVGLVLIVWLACALLESAGNRLGNTSVPAQKVALSVTQSEDGKSKAEDACYYPSMKKFYAKVICQEMDYSWNVWADSREELEESIDKEFRECSERIRDRINKREMNKPLYFRIG